MNVKSQILSLIIIMQLVSHSLHGQESDTTRLRKLTEHFWELFNTNRLKAIEPLNQAFNTGLISRNPEFEDDFILNKGIYYGSIGNKEKAKASVNQALSISKEQKDKLTEAKCYNELAIIYSEEGNFNRALPYYLKIVKLAEEKRDKRMEATMYINIAQIYKSLKLYSKELSYLRKSELVFKDLKDHRFLAIIYGLYFSYYLNQNDPVNMKTYLLKSEKEVQKIHDIQQSAHLKSNYGKYYKSIYNYPEALKSMREALVIYQSNKLSDQESMTFIDLGELCILSDQPDSAIVYAMKSIAITEKTKNGFRLTPAYDLLIKSYQKKNDYKKAFDLQVKKHHIEDSISGQQVKNKINELMIVHETEQKDLENQLLKEQKQRNELKISGLNYLVLGLALIMILLLTSYFFYSRNKKSKIANKQLELEQKAFRARMNPHFIFNSLNSIQRLYIEGKEELAGDYMADFSNLLRGILDNSGKNSVTLEEELRTTRLYLELEAKRTDHLFEYTIEIAKSVNTKYKLPPLIFQPYLENAIWHGILPNSTEPGQIKLIISQDNPNHLKCTITDNGVGYFTSLRQKKEINRSSKGMEITAERIGGSKSVSIEELPSGGTKITLIIPLKP
jgi:tetratricopeptide (TPR) repeat protein